MVDREYLKDSLLMASIASGFMFFATLAGFQVAQIRTDPTSTLIAAGVAAGGAFFMFLAGRMLPGPVALIPSQPKPPVVP